MITCYLLCTELTASLPPGSDLLNWSYAGSKLPMNARSIQAGGTVLEGNRGQYGGSMLGKVPTIELLANC